ncbi:MAG: beta-N-acetylhexosaminidase [Gammaproteobacteria bacterium]|nr:beta-N-acetylhexosaminidase [Gammaproteobacteria bacterium]
MSLGPLLVDIAGHELDEEDLRVLKHPLVGGVILFTRNFASIQQLEGLVKAIHDVRSPRLLVTVDHEGGRVQRFRESFTVLPPARAFGEAWRQDEKDGLALAERGGWLMASECLAAGIDLSFAPVLDLDLGISSIIGDRAFHRSVDGVSRLASAWMRGMKQAGMVATGKHFPGHGGIAGDSHLVLPVDTRPLADLEQRDMVPFRRLIANNIAAIMMAHVVYPDVDDLPASFSRRWIGEQLRGRLGFKGAVFCDDLSMEGAVGIGSYADRARLALEAGCDMLPVCNNRAGVLEILDSGIEHDDPASALRLARLHGRTGDGLERLQGTAEWQAAQQAVGRLDSGGQQLTLGEQQD